MNMILTLELAMKIEQGTPISLKKALKRMHALETTYEKVHMDSLVEIKDESLNKLFTALCQGDKAHRERLERLMQRVG